MTEKSKSEYVPFHVGRDRLESKLIPSELNAGSPRQRRWRRWCCRALVAALQDGALKAVFVEGHRACVPADSWEWTEASELQFARDDDLGPGVRGDLPILRGDERPMLEGLSLDRWLAAISSENPILLTNLASELEAGASRPRPPDVMSAVLGDFWAEHWAVQRTDGPTVGLPDGSTLAIRGWVSSTAAELHDGWCREAGGDDHRASWSLRRLGYAVSNEAARDDLSALRTEIVQAAIGVDDAIGLCRRLRVQPPEFLSGQKEAAEGPGYAPDGATSSPLALFAGGVTWRDPKVQHDRDLEPKSSPKTEGDGREKTPAELKLEEKERREDTAIEILKARYSDPECDAENISKDNHRKHVNEQMASKYEDFERYGPDTRAWTDRIWPKGTEASIRAGRPGKKRGMRTPKILRKSVR